MFFNKKQGKLENIGMFIIVFMAFAVIAGIGIMVNKTVSFALTNSTEFQNSPTAITAIENVQDKSVTKIDYIGMFVLAGLLLGMVIVGYFSVNHPVFAVLYIIGLISLGLVAGILSFTWQKIAPELDAITAGGVAINVTSDLPLTNFVMGNFLIFFAIAAFLGLVSMYIGGGGEVPGGF